MGPTDRVIVLIDMDCFYCQVEEKLNPTLKDKPIAVVQYNAWRGGGIIAVNYPARAEGVTRHMRGNEAKTKCPSIKLVQVPEVRGKADLTKYRDAGKEVADVLATFTPLLQRASVDEAYLDITEAVVKRIATNLNDLTADNLRNTYVVGSDLQDFIHNVSTNKEFCTDKLKLAVGGVITEEIRYEVFKKTGYKCSAGIAHNKILAKLVCGFHKPNKQTILPHDAVQKLFETTLIRKVTSLGGKFGQKISDDFNITFMGELEKIPEKDLLQKYDEKTAKWLYNLAKGIETEPVTTKLTSKSIGCCKNFTGRAALTTVDNVRHWLHELSEEMAERLEKDITENRRRAKHMVVSFSQEVNKQDVSSSRTHPLTSYDANKIARAAFEVINKFCLRSDGSYHLKFLGLSAGHFEDVKKVREITTFFQVGQTKSDDQKNTEVKCSITEPIKNPDTVEENVYCQLTQELDEDSDELTFYDDSCRVKGVDSITEEVNTNPNTVLSVSKDLNSSCGNMSSDDSQKLQSSDAMENPHKPLSSFFANFFTPNASSESPAENASMLQSIEDKNVQITEFSQKDIELSEICTECKENVPISELVSHQDYHFALKLSKNEATLEKPAIKTIHSSKKRGRPKALKTNVDSNNTLMVFFKKSEKDSTVETETCQQCNKKIKSEEMSSHMDYHTAKKLHLEINAITSVTFAGPSKPKLKKKAKNQSSNKSVISFFRPT